MTSRSGREGVIMWILLMLAMKVPEPKWPGMILRCDEQKNCHWVCEHGTVTVPQVIDGNEVQVSSGCVKDKPACTCPACGNSLFLNATPI